MLEKRHAKSVKIVTLLDKEEGRIIDMKADYVGFKIPNAFVVGYGLDFNEKYRHHNFKTVRKRRENDRGDACKRTWHQLLQQRDPSYGFRGQRNQ